MKRVTFGPFVVRWTCPRCGDHALSAFVGQHCSSCGVGFYNARTVRRRVFLKRAWWRRQELFWQVARP